MPAKACPGVATQNPGEVGLQEKWTASDTVLSHTGMTAAYSIRGRQGGLPREPYNGRTLAFLDLPK